VLLEFVLMLLSIVLWWDHKYVLVIGFWVLVGLVPVSWLLVRVMKRPVYSLVIETSGSSLTVLTSTNKDCLDRIVWEIMSAIDNPRAEYADYQVQV
jgi:hypothetical protein